MPTCTLNVARIETGYLIRIEGRGTSQDSPALLAFVNQYLSAEPRPSVVIDLSSCQYLDSTFLGCLLNLQRRCRNQSESRFVVVADRPTREKLLRTANLDKVLELVDCAPLTRGGFVRLNPAHLGPREFGRHVLEAHRALATLPSTHARLFQQIADQLEKELGGQRPTDDEPENIRETV